MSDHTNGRPLPFQKSEIPIVGQQIQIHGWFPTVLVTCKCVPTAAPLMIVGHEAVATCQSCGNQYALTSLAFNRAAGSGSLTVGQVGKAPAVSPT